MSNNLRTCEKHEDAVVIFKWEKECPLCEAEKKLNEGLIVSDDALID
jgi:hypothetical protein